jgi:cysteine desulfurase
MNFSTLRKNDGDEPSSAPPFTYLDHNATTPLDALVRAGVSQWLEAWGNPSSIHQAGRLPKLIIREARDKIARMLGVHALEVVFTSGGTEANNLALKGVWDFHSKSLLETGPRRKRVLISSVEHPSVRRTAEALTSRGAQVDFIPVSREGVIDLGAYEAMLGEDVLLVSVMLANNETGNVFPVGRMAELAHAKGALFHSDCVQALGKMPLNLAGLGVDLATFSGHKFYALKGAGFLYVRRGVQLESLIHGGGQERHRRGGTENVLAIASLGAMCDRRDEITPMAAHMKNLRDTFEARVRAEINDVTITGAVGERIGNTSSLVIPGVDGETMLMNLDLLGFAVSTGAACSSGSPEPSPVLLAMGLTRSEAQASLRIGVGWGTTSEQVDAFVGALKDVVARLRGISGYGATNGGGR